MKVKLQPPSATDLPAFNPILPPSAITQVMLLANPQNVSIHFHVKSINFFSFKIIYFFVPFSVWCQVLMHVSPIYHPSDFDLQLSNSIMETSVHM